MSVYSGRYDLADAISGMGSYLNKKESFDTKNQKEFNYCCSDIMEDFEAFKKATGGVIYQHIRITVDESNQDYIKEHCPEFNFIEHERRKIDKRHKKGYKSFYYFTYTYYNKEYRNLRELNEDGVWVTKSIYFDNILELIPYFPYVVVSMDKSKDKMCVVVSDRSYPESCFINHNWEGVEESYHYYRKNLAELTKEVILEYFIDYKDRTINQEFKVEKEGDRYIVHLKKPLDYNFKIELPRDNNERIWDYPIIIDDNTLDVTKTYYDIDKREKILIKYVSKRSKNI